MIASTLYCLSRLLFEYRGEALMSAALRTEVDMLYGISSRCGTTSVGMTDAEDTVEIGIVGILLRHESREVSRAALGAVKVACVSLDPSRLERIIPALLPSLIFLSNDSKNDLKLKVKIILERFLKKCGREKMEELFPATHHKLLTSVRKSHDRSVRKKNAKKEHGSHVKTGFEEAWDDGDGSGHDMSSDDEDSGMEEMAPTGKRGRSASSGKVQLGVVEHGTGDAMNLMDAEALGYQRDTQQLSKKKRSASAKTPTRLEFKTGPDGRPIFEEEEEAESKIAPDHDGYDKDDEPAKYSSRDLERQSNQKRKRAKNSNVHMGDEYKSSKAAGDMKVAGRPDPYAYVPLGSAMIGGSKKTRKGTSSGVLAKLSERKSSKTSRRKSSR